MTTKITVIYDNPEDIESFERAYPNQLTLAEAIPGPVSMETSRVWPKEDGTPAPAYRLVDLYFADYDAASDAGTSPEARRLLSSIATLATGGVRIVFADIERANGSS